MEKYIYQIKNKINGKSYIGQTNNIHRRFLEHQNYGYNKEEVKVLYDAMKKYGNENFDFIILEKTSNYNEREKYWIKELNTYINSDNCQGYNMTEGGEEPPILKGENSIFCTHSQKEIIEIKNKLKNTKISFKELAKEYKYNDESSIRRINSGEIWYDENDSYPIRQENTNQFKLERAKNIIEDLKYSTLTQKEISKKYNVSRTTITAINRGQNFSNLNDNYPIRPDDSLEKRKKNIKQYDLNNIFIKEFESVSAAARELNLNTSSGISACARGEMKTAYGFIWKY